MTSKNDVIRFHGFKGTTEVVVRGEPEPEPETFASIPKVDVSRIYSTHLADRQAIASHVRRAFKEVGFMYALNHGIPDEVEADVFRAAQSFFALPFDEKMMIHESKSFAKRGYQYIGEDKTDEPGRKDLREAFKVRIDPQDREEYRQSTKLNVWPAPESVPGFREALHTYTSAIQKFCTRFIQIIALALDLDERIFDNKMQPFGGLSLLRYPPISDGEGRGIHTDYSWFTLIHQLSPTVALEVLDANGHFVAVPPLFKSLVINVGDFLERVSNNIFASTIHRVINRASSDRYSLAYFYDPDPEATIDVVETCVSEERPRMYDSIQAGEWQKGLYLL